jgi:glutamyl/glutaminyl-tRNA synthetase
MGITHVIRGEDHISNTPKQMMVARALGGTPPDYAHVPLILGPDRKRLSKRHGAASVEDLEREGYLPRAVVNALALLGWSLDDKTTLMTVDELIAGFSVGRISKSPAIFDLQRLGVINGRHMRLMAPAEFEEALVDYLRKTGYIDERGPEAEELVRRTAPLVKRKMSTLSEYDELAGWLFRPLAIEPEAWEVLTRDVKHSIQVIGGGLGRLEALPDWSLDAIKEALQDQLHIMGEAARDFLEPQRIAITGRLVSTGSYESLALLGREESVARYRQTLARLADEWGHAA